VAWNPFTWLQVGRLRSAIEIDCDTRVVRYAGNVGAYGSLLLEVGRRSTRTPLAAAAFSEASSQLERRIRMLIRGRNRRGWIAAATAGAGAVALLLVSCEVPQPQPVSPGEDFLGGAEATTGSDATEPGTGADGAGMQPGEEVLSARRVTLPDE